MYTPLSSSLRFIEPKVEIYARDRRSGAYPTKAKTGDRTRTGRNALYFDDTRTVVFMSGVSVNMPTTLQMGSSHLANDLTSSFAVTGNVIATNVDEWIAHRAQTERPGPFVESNLHEQDHHAIVNSTFLTGVAYRLAPDKFKSRLSDKTIVRIEVPLTSAYAMDPLTSSLGYLNPAAAGFQEVAKENALLTTQVSIHPAAFAPLPFTPYGFHYLPLNNHHLRGGGLFARNYSDKSELSKTYPQSIAYEGEGENVGFFVNEAVQMLVTASVANPRHAAMPSQAISLSGALSAPFLLEKAVIEFPFKAGAGWLNDRYEMRPSAMDSDNMVFDAGGPMITIALMRQDKAGRKRDIIASGTITTQLDMVTGTYNVSTISNTIGGFDIVHTPVGVRGILSNPTVVITGSTLSGSTNTYTGSIRMVLEPQITSHILRMRASGSAHFFLNLPDNNNPPYNDVKAGDGAAFSPITNRTNRTLGSGRNILGNSFAFVPRSAWDSRVNPVHVMDTQFESLARSGSTLYSKLYLDVVSNTTSTPYLLHPQDDLIVCVSKHRAVALTSSANWAYGGSTSTLARPAALSSNHDVAIPTGTFRITLYGDLIRQDQEFHDTLNQRLETVELWETVGEDPVLDQFDVFYRHELSGTFIDRFSVLSIVNSTLDTNLSASRQTEQFYSNYSENVVNSSWSTQFAWSRSRRISELQKSARTVVHKSNNELFWDTRIPNPGEVIHKINPSLVLAGYDTGAGGMVQYALTTGAEFWGPDLGGAIHTTNGIYDWGMRFPYEPRNGVVTQQFSDTLFTHVFRYKLPGGAMIISRELNYNDLTYEVGSGSLKLFSGDVQGANVNGMGRAEFLKAFFGIGAGRSSYDNQHVTYRTKVVPNFWTKPVNVGVNLRGWRYGMMSAFPTRNIAIYRRDRYGHFRDMLEQRLDGKFFNEGENAGVREGAVQVKFYDRDGNLTSPELTLSSNLSFEATSSVPYFDGVARNRTEIDYSNLNISSVVF